MDQLVEVASKSTKDRAGLLLRLSDISKSYGGAVVLDGVNLDVHAGEIIALIGENGAGKSTLMRICAGLMSPDRGTVERNGLVGYCPQVPGVMDLLTANEHFGLFDSAPVLAPGGDGPAILESLRFPLEDIDGKVSRDMSGGTRQKLNLALALLGRAEVLLLDEPYQGFDRGSYLDFWEFADQWRTSGRAVIVVTHLLTELDRVDRVVELRLREIAGGGR
jgi:ABC-type multidrug transport system ATPase subunit